MVVTWLSIRLRAPLFFALGVAACTAEPSDGGLTQTATTVSTTGPEDTSGATMTTTTTTPDDTSTTDTPSDTSTDSDTSCAGEIVEAPDAPEGWFGPVVTYGFEGNVGEAPDCGGDVGLATRLSLVNADTTVCACGCDAAPEQLCAVSMFGDCDGTMQIGTYGGECQQLGEAPVLQFQATSIPLGSCVSSPVPGIPPATPSLWGCEIPDNGCSEAPDINRVCIYAPGTASGCPAGFENGPIGSQQVLCEGECDNCMTPEYCSMLQLELHDTADCSGIPAQTAAPLECPGGQFSAVRATQTQLTCMPAVELTRTQQVVSVCCVP